MCDPQTDLRITGLRTRTVGVPIGAPLRHSSGVHPGYFVRTLVELTTTDGIVGIGEVGGGDHAARIQSLAHRVIGEDPFHLERIKHRVLSRIHYLRSPRIYAAIEMACLDIIGKAIGRRVCDLLGGPVRAAVPFAAYLFTTASGPDRPAVEHPDDFVRLTRSLVAEHGFGSAKLKAGVVDPRVDIEVLDALRNEFGPTFPLRVDPNGTWSVATA